MRLSQGVGGAKVDVQRKRSTVLVSSWFDCDLRVTPHSQAIASRPRLTSCLPSGWWAGNGSSWPRHPLVSRASVDRCLEWKYVLPKGKIQRILETERSIKARG